MPDRLAAVLAYHERTKHRFQAYAQGPEALDWDAQPRAFRHFDGASSIALPLAARRFDRPFGEAATPPVPLDLASIGAFLELSLAVSAWKSFGPDRWAVRCNPSSGNLHPTEAYLLCRQVAPLADGVHHYRPQDHALELRGELPAVADRSPQLWIGLTSLLWREAWKYGERSFRYCQLDVGHAVAALAYAARLLGWHLRCVDGLPHARLAALLGTDRSTDFANTRRPYTEFEEAELLLAVTTTAPAHDRPPLPTAVTSSGNADAIPEFDLSPPTVWHGRASVVDAHPMYHWPLVEEIAALTRDLSVSPKDDAGNDRRVTEPPTLAHHKQLAECTPPREYSLQPPAPLREPVARTAAQLPPARARSGTGPTTVALLGGRRSAQRFDPTYVLPLPAFCQLLDATLPRPQAPWTALPEDFIDALLLFVHRVDGLAPGLYLFERTDCIADLSAAVRGEHVAGLPVHLKLYPLALPADFSLARLSRALQCHQDIAATSCFSLGMLARFATVLAQDPAAYRALFHAAGLLGQVLYLEAEALGLRGTGIGCYFDDEVHALLGLTDARVQSLYHFTIGQPVTDPRIESSPAYPDRPAPMESV
jgi:SagB-type dehydrogenase family enzyme